ncbi:hypothetical protein ACVBEH_30930, partial [Roseateles sp. GG27B]
MVDRVLALRATLRGRDKPVEGAAVDPAAQPVAEIDRTALLAELHIEQEMLSALQGDTPLIMPSVDGQAVASVVAD